MKFFANFTIRKTIIYLALTALVIGVPSYFVYQKRTSEPNVSIAKITRGKILQTVSETGTVKSEDDIALGFNASGRITRINVAVGDKVQKDDVLAEMDSSSLLARKDEAVAGLDMAVLSLNKLLAGSTNEEIAIARANESQALTNYESAKKEQEKIINSIRENTKQAESSYNDLDPANNKATTVSKQAVIQAQANLENVKKINANGMNNVIELILVDAGNSIPLIDSSLDLMNSIIKDDDVDGLLSARDTQILNNTSKSLLEVATYLKTVKSTLTNMQKTQTSDTASKLVADLIVLLNKNSEALQFMYKALEQSVTSSAFTQTELDAYKTAISAKQTLVNGEISRAKTDEQNLSKAILNYNVNLDEARKNLDKAQVAYDNAVTAAKNQLSTTRLTGEQQLTGAETKVMSAEKSWMAATAQLDKVLANADRYDILLAQAKVRQAKAVVNTINKQLEDSKIIAPIDAVVTSVDYKLGEQATPGRAAIKILRENKYYIEALISEAEIDKLKRGQKARITFDAFGSDREFNGSVDFINPAETVVQEVVYYKVKINFDNAGQNIKSGMTANAIITAFEKDGVLLIPSRAIIDRGEAGKLTRVYKNKLIEERKISVGVRGDEGSSELLGGVKEGEDVVTFVNP